jgi:mono/diheme cytochrome c family protein
MRTVMKRKTLPLALVVAAISALPLAQAKTRFVLKSEDVKLPQSDRGLPEGPGREAVQSNCFTCHSAGMILTQPSLPKAAWQAEVAKMRNVYKAAIDDKDVPAIVDYLTAVKGPK